MDFLEKSSLGSMSPQCEHSIGSNRSGFVLLLVESRVRQTTHCCGECFTSLFSSHNGKIEPRYKLSILFYFKQSLSDPLPNRVLPLFLPCVVWHSLRCVFFFFFFSAAVGFCSSDVCLSDAKTNQEK